MVPNLSASEPVRLLFFASQVETSSPRNAFDLISADDLFPRDPWRDLAAGQDPIIEQDKDRVGVSFAVALPDLEWDGFDLMRSAYLDAGRFSLAMMQRVDSTWRSWVALASIRRTQFRVENGRWEGRVTIDLYLVRELERVAELPAENAA